MAEAKTFKCPNCGSSVSTTGAEKEVKCAYCGSTVIVPEELRDQPAPAQVSFGQSGQFDSEAFGQVNQEVLETVGNVGKVAAGVTVGVTAISVILPIALTCIILVAVGAFVYFISSSVNSATNSGNNPQAPIFASAPTDTAIPPTEAPTPFDTPVAYTKLLFKDSFAKSSSGWDVTRSANYTLEYKNGKYHILIAKPDSGQLVWKDFNFTDTSVAADVQETSGPNDGLMGVMCRATQKSGMYTFEFDQNGDYGIYKYDTNGNATALAEGALNPNTVNHGGTNHIAGFCVGSTLTLVLNGQALIQTDDSDLTTGGVGMVVRPGSSGEVGIDTLYANFLVNGP